MQVIDKICSDMVNTIIIIFYRKRYPPHNDLFKIPINSEVRVASAMKTKKPKIPPVLIKSKWKEAKPALLIMASHHRGAKMVEVARVWFTCYTSLPTSMWHKSICPNRFTKKCSQNVVQRFGLRMGVLCDSQVWRRFSTDTAPITMLNPRPWLLSAVWMTHS